MFYSEYEKDNKKEILTKEMIRAKLLPEFVYGFAFIMLGAIAFTFLAFMIIPVMESVGGPTVFFVCFLAVLCWGTAVYYSVKLWYIGTMHFIIDSDKVTDKAYENAPATKKPSRKYEKNKAVMEFGRYGWVIVSNNTYRYSDVDDECWVAVMGKKTVIGAYNKKYFDYRE